MISAQDWWQVIGHYGAVVAPAQIAAYLAAAAVTLVFLLRPGERSARIVQAYLAVAFGWIGVVFFLMHGSALPARFAQAFLFLSLAALYAVQALAGTLRFALPEDRASRLAMYAGAALVLLAYPAAGALQGRPPSQWLTPGVFPCPTTALALVFLFHQVPSKRPWLQRITVLLLLIWAIPFPIAIQIPKFGVYEDGIMLAAGLYSFTRAAGNKRLVRSWTGRLTE